MNRQTYIASFALTVLAGCATQPEPQVSLEGDPSKSLPEAASGFAPEPLYYASSEEAQKALSGYNYGLTLLPDGKVQAYVSGLIGSGSDNPLQIAQAGPQNSQATGAVGSEDGSETPFVQISLAEKTNGQAAIDALGDKIAEVAKAYDMSAERLEEILRTDSTAWIDEGGRLLYIDAPPPLAEGEGQGAVVPASGIGVDGMSDAASTDAFALHSKPGSNRSIYLDFNGHVVTGSAWYSGTLTAQAYDIDANPGSFSATELNNIKQIWQRVAEDYAPFDVDITTQEPSLDALRRTSGSDAQYGTRAVITRSMPQLCSQACGGVAYVNAFTFYSATRPDAYQPAWVFLDKLGNGYPKYVAEAISHEVGHNLNLNHDGNASTGYYAGQGSGVTGWAPIMGVGYYKPLTQWSKGEYPGANNLQDDVAVIHAAGANLRADDYADTIASAAPLAGDSSAVAQSGLIERATDIDLFTFNTGGGSVQFKVSPDAVAANLDVQLKLLDAKGAAILVANPADSLSANLSTVLNAGQYFLQVEGVGMGDLTTGYSDYASLGRYQITGNYPKQAVAALSPTALITAIPTVGNAPLSVSMTGANSSDRDGSIAAYEWNFGDGSAPSRNVSVNHVYNTPGAYNATLTVTDNSGLKNMTSRAVQVSQSPVAVSMRVASVKVSRKLLSGGKSQCVASVTVNYSNSLVSGAGVYGIWSGSVVAGSAKTTLLGSTVGMTANTGIASVSSPVFASNSKGTCAFSVLNVSKSGYSYDGGGSLSGSFSW